MNIDKAIETQLANIEKRTGKTLAQLGTIIKNSGLTKHGELVAMLKADLGMGHGDANTLVHHTKKSDGVAPASGDVVDDIYTGAKAPLRPVHDTLMVAIAKIGAFEIAPKKGYVSLRCKKQFAMIGPATNTQVEVGLNMKGVKGTARLIEQKPGGMCQYKVRVADRNEVDAQLIGWIRAAYDAAQ
jgi:D-alanyl-D-alanine carboxypeptidase